MFAHFPHRDLVAAGFLATTMSACFSPFTMMERCLSVLVLCAAADVASKTQGLPSLSLFFLSCGRTSYINSHKVLLLALLKKYTVVDMESISSRRASLSHMQRMSEDGDVGGMAAGFFWCLFFCIMLLLRLQLPVIERQEYYLFFVLAVQEHTGSKSR